MKENPVAYASHSQACSSVQRAATKQSRQPSSLTCTPAPHHATPLKLQFTKFQKLVSDLFTQKGKRKRVIQTPLHCKRT